MQPLSSFGASPYSWVLLPGALEVVVVPGDRRKTERHDPDPKIDLEIKADDTGNVARWVELAKQMVKDEEEPKKDS
jgi:hypothetical protein